MDTEANVDTLETWISEAMQEKNEKLHLNLPSYIIDRLVDARLYRFGFTGLKKGNVPGYVGQILVGLRVPEKPGRNGNDGIAFWYVNVPFSPGEAYSSGDEFKMPPRGILKNMSYQEVATIVDESYDWLVNQIRQAY